MKIAFFVADDDLAREDLLIVLPVLRHLKIDTRNLLEKYRSTWDGVDCSLNNNSVQKKGGTISRMMISSMNSIIDEEENPSKNRPEVDYYETRLEKDPFPGSCGNSTRNASILDY